jgi:hypothetical protein
VCNCGNGRNPRRGERGQILILGALMMTVMIGFLALVIDVGNAYAQRRFVQNGADAAAVAAARLLANNLDTGTADASVVAVVNQYLGANGGGTFVPSAGLTADEGAWYVTQGGTRIRAVGSGVTIPVAPSNGFPQLAGQSVAGVEVVGRKQFGTFFAGMLGYKQMTVRAASTAGFGSASSVLLDWSQTGVPVAPLAFDIEAVTTKLAACGGYGATIQFDQYIDTPTECIFDTEAHYSFSTLNIGNNCSNATVKDTLDQLIDNPQSFGGASVIVDQTRIQVCHGIRSSSLRKIVDIGRPVLVPLVSHTDAMACRPKCDALVVGFAYMRATQMYGNGSGAYHEGYWVDPRTMDALRNTPVSTTTTRILGPLSFALVR